MLYMLGFMALLIVIPLWAQSKVKKAYKKYSQIKNSTGMTGADVARKILDENGLYDVQINEVQGQLSDHYDPRKKVVNLSSGIYHGQSIAGTAVASHEVGHAIQDSKEYAPLRIRSSLVPVASLGSNLAFPMIIFGALFNMLGLAYVGIIFFACAVLFQLVTLPVEFDASSRALAQIQTLGIVQGDEQSGARKVLNAAALTYVAAALVAVLQLLWFLLSIVGMGDD